MLSLDFLPATDRKELKIEMKCVLALFSLFSCKKHVYMNTFHDSFFNLFRLCNPLRDNDDDISNFAISIAGNFMGVVQYNKDNRKFEV